MLTAVRGRYYDVLIFQNVRCIIIKILSTDPGLPGHNTKLRLYIKCIIKLSSSTIQFFGNIPSNIGTSLPRDFTYHMETERGPITGVIIIFGPCFCNSIRSVIIEIVASTQEYKIVELKAENYKMIVRPMGIFSILAASVVSEILAGLFP